MITNAAKHYLALAGFGFVFMVLYTAGDAVGLTSVDTPDELWDSLYRSIVSWQTGDLYGFVLLASVGVAGCIGIYAVLATRGAGEHPADVRDEVPLEGPSIWPVATALSLGIAAVGVVVDPLLAVVGLALLAVVLIEWSVQGWSERYSDDAERNAELRTRFMGPFEVPIFGFLLIVTPILLFSRALLASSKVGASVLAIVVASVVLAIFFVLYYVPKLASREVMVGLAAVGAVAVIVSGIVGAAVGQREFENILEHGHSESEEQSEDEDHSEEESEEGLGSLSDVVDTES